MIYKRLVMAKASPAEFVRQVRSEARKVTWPTRAETITSTIAVFIMATLAAIFLYGADQLMAWIVRMIMEIGV